MAMPREHLTDFDNPHADDPDLAEAYEAGYREAAFGTHDADKPSPFPAGPQSDAWKEGFVAGARRFRAYQKGYARGITQGLQHEGTIDPMPNPHPPGDLANAWGEGQQDGLLTARVVRDDIATKALEIAHFDQPAGPIHGSGWYWQEWNGGRAIYVQRPADHELPPDAVFAVDAPIHAEYQRLGGVGGLLGRPVGDTENVPDGRGTVSEFQNGTMYATEATGAREVHGLIRQHWLERGGPRSDLGYPTSNELDERADHGKVNTFERGDLYFWPDTGVVEVAGIQVRYRGQNCFGESDEISAEDETYIVASTVGPTQETIKSTTTSIADVNGGGSYPDFLVLYSGAPAGIGALAVTMMEHDAGNPDQYRTQIEGGVRLALNGLAGAIAATGVGLPVSGIALALANAGAGPIANAINSAIGSGDDLIGTDVFPLAPKSLIELARAELQRERDVEFNLATKLLSADGGSYKAYFDVDFV
ncbi:LGFP repeat-containing protein [Amycolatopsis vastitatis]|uniref:LGFP repeat-containing protein n=1 Tax=Amycolatopsis vastitatis TaxID=1905142 RepID=A0A229TC23_9PSEU|nr:hypothetical protein [Amycolatopsis vastitatis]OXM68464.1 hypothetical protein CF165_13210 [Amycolatopsis vastitatis]